MDLPSRQSKRMRRGPQALVVAVVLLLLGTVLAAGIGTVHIGPGAVLGIVLHKLGVPWQVTWPHSWEAIILMVRLPRVAMAVVVGMALALAGTVLQGLFKNPLADPYIIGVSAGASLGAVVGFALLGSITTGMIHLFSAGGKGTGLASWGPLTVIPLLAFAGGLLAVLLVYRLSRVGGQVPVTSLLLAGVAVGSVMTSLLSVVVLYNLNQADKIWLWLMGGLGASSWTQVLILLPYVGVSWLVLLFVRQDLNALLLGEETARHLGVHAERVKLLLLVISTLLTASAVAFVGAIGFVGLVVPHVVRFLVGPDNRYVLPISGLAGGFLLVIADMLGRIGTTEIPAGAIMALLGGPFFLGLLRRQIRQQVRRV